MGATANRGMKVFPYKEWNKKIALGESRDMPESYFMVQGPLMHPNLLGQSVFHQYKNTGKGNRPVVKFRMKKGSEKRIL